jgi:two-component system, OmpR family, heavy metal sensor histidine kinase CusS
MKLRSFRLRLAMISAASAAIGLFVFGLVASSLWRKDRIARLDEELVRRGHVLASLGRSKEGWDKIYQTMESMVGEEKIDSRFLVVRRQNGTPFYASNTWPTTLDQSEFKASDETFEWRGSGRDFFRPPGPWRNRGERAQRTQNQNQNEERRPSRRNPFAKREGPPTRTIKMAKFYEASDGDQQWRIGVFGNSKFEVLLGASLDEMRGELRSLWLSFATASTGALTLIAMGSWLLARKALTPIEALTEATKNVSAGDLSTRIDLTEADKEFQPLISVYNTTMARLERSFHQATRFSADASHELKTPVAIMKGILERALADSKEGSREQAIYTSLLEETDHQQAILQTLLILSQADAGRLQTTTKPTSLSDLASHALDDAEMMAEEDNLEIRSKITSGLQVEGDATLLQQVLHNLITNAVKYNQPQGWLSVALEAAGNEAVLQVANSGEAIPEEAQGRLFERFYRAEAARTNREDGIGLGLSLSLELVKAHNGTLKLLRSNPEETVFELRLPLLLQPDHEAV